MLIFAYCVHFIPSNVTVTAYRLKYPVGCRGLSGPKVTNPPPVDSDVLTPPFQFLDLSVFLKANEVGLATDDF